ncbi:MAG: outer membrane beta-barrel protein [bacterium]|nr:outer membrane beta-barrel protein [bacterium]
MNKKVFAIILIVCLAFGVAFAAKASGLRVGAQAGYGGYSLQFTDKENAKNFIRMSNGGFYFAGTAEYSLSPELSAKVEAGVNTMGKVRGTVSYDGKEESMDATKASPINFALYAGAQYCIEISKQFCVDLGAGFDVLMGKMAPDDDDNESFNATMGIGLEAAAAYHVNDNIKVSLGGKFAWHFINTNKDLDSFIQEISNDAVTTNFAFQAYAGVSYAF